MSNEYVMKTKFPFLFSPSHRCLYISAFKDAADECKQGKTNFYKDWSEEYGISYPTLMNYIQTFTDKGNPPAIWTDSDDNYKPTKQTLRIERALFDSFGMPLLETDMHDHEGILSLDEDHLEWLIDTTALRPISPRNMEDTSMLIKAMQHDYLVLDFDDELINEEDGEKVEKLVRDICSLYGMNKGGRDVDPRIRVSGKM